MDHSSERERPDDLASGENGAGRSNFGALKERVNNIDRRLGELVFSLEKVSFTIQEAGKTKWTTITGLASVVFAALAGIWLLVIIPIKDDIKDIRSVAVTRDNEHGRESYVDKELLRFEAELKDKASKDDLNRVIIEIDRRHK